MKIVIYNTNSYDFDGNIFHYENYPTNKECWLKTLENYKNHEIVFVTQFPSLFLLDLQNNKVDLENLNVIIADKNADANQIYQIIKNQHPDFVISASYWIAPFDWLCVKDSLVGEKLEKDGIKTIYNSSEFTLNCFDKYKTHQLLKFNGFSVADAVYVNHDLFWAERNRCEVLENVYKESVFEKIKTMNFPLVIKDTCGLSSFGMEVVRTFGEAKNFLCSKKNNGDRIVENLISGLQFGTEIYCYDNEIVVSDPFIFSVNQYGITSPKQSVKTGPVTNEKYRISELKSELKRLAKNFNLKGTVQVDLVFNETEEKWYIIEINPRLSGMTRTVCASYGINVSDLILSFKENKNTILKQQKKVCAIKFQLLTEKQINDFYKLPYVLQINQTKNDAAKQRRECGYCEVIFGGTENPEELKAELNEMKEKFPEIMEEVFYKNAMELISKLYSAFNN